MPPRSYMTEKDYDIIYSMRVLASQPTAIVASASGRSKQSVNAVSRFALSMINSDWDEVITIFQRGYIKQSVALQWAKTRLGISCPDDVLTTLRTIEVHNGRAVKDNAQEPEPDLPPESSSQLEIAVPANDTPDDNTALAIASILDRLDKILSAVESLHNVIQFATSDLKDNMNANSDMLHQDLDKIRDAAYGIKANTRKRGL